MTRFLTYGTLVACVLGVLGAAGRQQPVFRGEGDAVRVFVTVTDRDGRLITTLTRDDFEVRDEGKPQSITLFDNTPQPVRLIVMLDVSGSMHGNLPLLRGAAEQLFARLGQDGPRTRRRVRARDHHQSLVHRPSRGAPEGAAGRDCSRCAHAALARARRGDGRVRRRGRRAPRDPRAERRQGQRPDQLPAQSSPARPRSLTARATIM